MDIEILRSEPTSNILVAPLAQTAIQPSVSSDNEEEQCDQTHNRFQRFMFDGINEQSAFDKSRSSSFSLDRNTSPNLDSNEQETKQTALNSLVRRRNQEPENPMQKILLGKKKKGKKANILSDKLTEKKVQTRLNLGPSNNDFGTPMENKLTLDVISPGEELEMAQKNSAFQYFYDKELFQENNRLLFKNISSPEEAMQPLKLTQFRTPYIKVSRSYYERQLSKTVSDIYPGILLNKNDEKENDDETKPYSLFRRNLGIVKSLKKRKYFFFEKPNVTMCEYDQLPPSNFNIQDVEILHETDRSYFESQLKTLVQEEEEKKESKRRLEELRRMEEETDIEDSEPEYFQPLSYNVNDINEEMETILSSVYEPEPLVWSKRTKKETLLEKENEATRKNVEIIDFRSDVEIPDYTSKTHITTPTRQKENNTISIDEESDENIEVIEIPESPMAFKIDSLFSGKQVDEFVLKAQQVDSRESQHLMERNEVGKEMTNILQQKSVNLLTQQQPSKNNQLYQKKKRDFTKLTTSELRKQVDEWGFKPCRTRTEMIKLLDSCNVYSPIPGSVLANTMSRKENMHIDTDLSFQKKSYSKNMIQTINQLPKHEKDLEKLSIGDLKELLNIYGFKPINGRSRILEILRKCYKTTNAVVTSTETTPETFEINASSKTTDLSGNVKESNAIAMANINDNETEIVVSVTNKNSSTKISTSNLNESISNLIVNPNVSSSTLVIQESNDSESYTHADALERMNTKELRELIKQYGFKPVKSRSRMIDLLKDCYSPSPAPAPVAKDENTLNSNSDKALDLEISRRISTALLTESFAVDIWTKILTYEPLNLDELCEFLEEKLGMKLDSKFVREWCDQHGVTTTVAEERT